MRPAPSPTARKYGRSRGAELGGCWGCVVCNPLSFQRRGAMLNDELRSCVPRRRASQARGRSAWRRPLKGILEASPLSYWISTNKCRCCVTRLSRFWGVPCRTVAGAMGHGWVTSSMVVEVFGVSA